MTTWVPVAACTLPTAEQPLRVAEFDALFTEALTGIVRHSATSATFLLGSAAGLRERTRDLIDRETACCSFFTFTVSEQPDGGLHLLVEVPSAHAEVLSGLIARTDAAPSSP